VLTPRDLDDLILSCYLSRDFHEGVRAFLEKRKPDWQVVEASSGSVGREEYSGEIQTTGWRRATVSFGEPAGQP
jgi:hypothetical protein